ncbi:DUF6338 family protein [Bacillus thuringiensis]|uniref:DUF6338 family protein n=2 Tax=Bacillus TaxID=1386 RepID=UPI0021002AF7|nr:DUF6338 family protein [Bacillus thuringiensis]
MNDISELTIRLLLIFFPGIISLLIIDTLTPHRVREFKMFLLHSFILGLASYFLLYVFISINNFFVIMKGLIPTWKVSFLNSLVNKQASIDIKEVVIATIVAILLAFAISTILNRKFLHKLAKKMGISKKFGQLDVWSYVFDSPEAVWVIIRDLENDLMYQGWVEAFSDTFDNNELFIRDVDVYRNSDAQLLYSMQAVYITKDKSNLVIEFP